MSTGVQSSTGMPNGNAHIQELDVVIVGTGFCGSYLLHRLRKLGYKVKAYEAGAGLGGVWFWNAYPGARVDTVVPLYQFSDPELYQDWYWKEKFPARDEIREYFKHVDRKWNLSKDIQFNTRVTAANFDANEEKWVVHTNQGDTVQARYFLLATGFASKLFVPQIKGLETFKGESFHTALWPQEGINLKGKCVGVIGTGASGVQVIQEAGPVSKELTVFQRTPNTALRMAQAKLDKETQQQKKKEYARLYEAAKQTFGGNDYDLYPKKMSEESPERNQAFLEELWEEGGFHIWVGNYKDVLESPKTNETTYKFWRDKVRQRITKQDPELIENLAPEVAPHPWGAKRPSLEQTYYEVYNQPNVELVNIKKTPILEITPEGLKTAEKEYKFDVLVVATGFDSVTGGITNIDIRGTDHVSLKEKWKNGIDTHLGMATAGYPNMFFLYGPQGPTALALGPTMAEIQGDWIVGVIEHMKHNNRVRIDALPEAEASWTQHCNDLAGRTLFPNADSWYMGANIPGKRRQMLNYCGGLPMYQDAIEASAKNGYTGFAIS
jgi:cation diffusion facilitator CzcD-associated flavoprotein CzcO